MSAHGMQAFASGVLCACTWVPVIFHERAMGEPTRVFATCTNQKCGNYGKRFVLLLTVLGEASAAHTGCATLGTKA